MPASRPGIALALPLVLGFAVQGHCSRPARLAAVTRPVLDWAPRNWPEQNWPELDWVVLDWAEPAAVLPALRLPERELERMLALPRRASRLPAIQPLEPAPARKVPEPPLVRDWALPAAEPAAIQRQSTFPGQK